MEDQPAEYLKLPIKQYAPRALRETAEGKFWRQFQAPILAKQFGAISHISCSEEFPYKVAVTASTRVIIYDAHTMRVTRTIARFKDKAYSGSLRRDGKLLVAGGQDSIVNVFDTSSRAILRQLKGHKGPVHVAGYSPDNLHVLSGGDDVTVRWWDVTMGQQLGRLTGHQDYVRAAACSPNSGGDVWATGGYDHTVRLWDVRSGSCTLTLEHSAPVEDVAFFPSGGMAVSAGGNFLCVWDLLGGGRLLAKLANFQKTVTCVSLSPLAGPKSTAAPRMLAGSTDGHVKVFELDTFKITHASHYPNPVLSLALAPDCSLLAVGMADGTLALRKQRIKLATSTPAAVAAAQRKQAYRAKLTAASYRYFIRGQSEKAAAHDFRVAARSRANLAPYDRLLRKFRHAEALDAALATRRAEVVASVVDELAARGALEAALCKRDAFDLLPLLQHVSRHITDPRHTQQLAAVAHHIVDAYSALVGMSPEVDAQLALLRERVQHEVKVADMLMHMQGMLDPMLAGSVGSQFTVVEY